MSFLLWRNYRPLAVGIDPSTLSPTMLLDKDVGITTDVGVSAWTDAGSSGADLAQATGGNQPANGSDGPQGDGTDDWLETTVTMDNIISSSAYTAVMVFNPISANRNQVNYNANEGILELNTLQVWGASLKTASSGSLQVGHFDGDFVQVESSVTLGSLNIACWKFNGTTLKLRINNGSYVSTTGGNIGSINRILRMFRMGDFYAESAVSDLAIWNTALSDSDIDGVRDWYNNKRSVY